MSTVVFEPSNKESLSCPRWSMLKQWMVSDGKIDAITVEEKYVKWSEQLRTDKYTTVSHMHHNCF